MSLLPCQEPLECAKIAAQTIDQSDLACSVNWNTCLYFKGLLISRNWIFDGIIDVYIIDEVEELYSDGNILEDFY